MDAEDPGSPPPSRLERIADWSPLWAFFLSIPLLVGWSLLPGYTLDKAWPAFFVVAGPVAMVTWVLCWRVKRSKPQAVFTTILNTVCVTVFVGHAVFLALHMINRWGDSSVRDETAVVVDSSSGRSTRIVVQRTGHADRQGLSGWGNVYRTGDVVRLRIHAGRLGWEWTEAPSRP